MLRTNATRALSALLFALTFITALAAHPGSASAVFQSDDFSAATLDTTVWTVADPLGDATLQMTGTNLLVHVPGRVAHTMWDTSRNAPLLLQPMADADFELEAKFDAQPSQQYQIQGFIVREDDDTFLRFDVHYNGTGPRIFAAYVNGINPPSIKINTPLASFPSYLRVTRTANLWSFSYSSDGSSWTSAGSFTRFLAVADAGVFIGNEAPGEYETPAFTGSIDYVFNTASPISPEDGGLPTAEFPPMVELWYGDAQTFGHLGVPQEFVNVLGTVWGPHDVSSLSYTLNGGASNPLTVGPDGARLVGFGDYNIEIAYDDLVMGLNSVVITATDTLGASRDTTVTIDFTNGTVWALPDTASFTTAAQISDEAHVVDGVWSLVDDGVRIEAADAGYERLLVLGDLAWPANYEVTLPLTVHQAGVGGESSIEIVIGWQGHSGPGQPRSGGQFQAIARIDDFGGTAMLQLAGGGGATLDQVAVSPLTDQLYLLKVRTSTLGADQSAVAVRFWRDGDPEPGTWDLEAQVPTRGGSVLLVADNADATFGDVVVEPVAGLGYQLDVTVVGNGTVTRSPDYDLYADSTVVQLTATPDPGYAFLGWSGGLSGRDTPVDVTVVSDTSVTATFVPAIVSDDFSGPSLNTSLWRVVDPIGDVTLHSSGTNLLFEIPGGISHDLWGGSNFAPRILQPSSDTDFEIEAKFDSRGTYTYHSHGLIVAQDDDTFLRFDVVYSGGVSKVFAGLVDGDSAYTRMNHTPAVYPAYLRVTREGDKWRVKYSEDGVAWNAAGNFNQTIVVTETGVFAANHNAAEFATPAYVANFDYFFNTAQPIAPEDGGAPSAETPPLLYVWYGDTQDVGHMGTPEHWWNIVGQVLDSDPIATLSYTVNGGASSSLSMGPDDKRLTGVGDYIIEIPFDGLDPGANTVVITAVDSLGEQTDKTVTLNYTPGGWWDLPYTADFTSAAELGDVAHAVAGLWTLSPQGIRNAAGRTGYDRCVVVGDKRWMTDYEVEGTVTIHQGNLGGMAGVGFIVGWQGHEGTAQPRIEPPFQSAGWIRNVPSSPLLELRDDELIRAQVPVTIELDTTYVLKVRSEYVSPTQRQVSAKVWQTGTPEPGWQLSDLFTARDGSLLLVSHVADATFGPVTVTPLSHFPDNVLTVQTVGMGTVDWSPQQPSYNDGDEVVFTATPDSGWVFDGWTSGLSGSQTPDTLVIDSDTTVVASFSVETIYALTTNVIGNGTLIKVPDQPLYAHGDTVIVSVLPDLGWVFDSWSGALSGNETPDTLVMVSDTSLTATFTQDNFVLDITVVGNGAATKSPDKPKYTNGEQVVVTAAPDSGWSFCGWTGDLTSPELVDTVTIAGNTYVTSTFGVYEVQVTVSGDGSVSLKPDKAYYVPGEQVVLTAAAGVGQAFDGWSGDHTGSANPDTVTVDSTLAIVATFVDGPTGIGDTPALTQLTIRHNSPNPFTTGTFLNYGLPRTADVTIDVFDAAGRRVYSRRFASVAPGWHQVYFDGRGNDGMNLPSGVYFYRVSTNYSTASRKMVILR